MSYTQRAAGVEGFARKRRYFHTPLRHRRHPLILYTRHLHQVGTTHGVTVSVARLPPCALDMDRVTGMQDSAT